MLSVPAGGRPKAETVKVVKAHRGPSNDHVHAHHILLFHAPAYSKTFSSATKSPGIVQTCSTLLQRSFVFSIP